MERPKGDVLRTDYTEADKQVNWYWGKCGRCRDELRPKWMDKTLDGAARRTYLVNGFTCSCPQPLPPILDLS